jgi:hypothetical protein
VTIGCGSVSARNDAGGGGGDDASGTTDGQVGPCEASQALRCDGTTLVSCNAQGTAEELKQCALRCNSTSLACEDKVAPSNGYASELDMAVGQPAISITQNTIIHRADFNSTTGMITIGTQQAKATLVAGTNGAPDVVVVSVGSLTVASGVQLSVGYPDNPSAAPPSHRPMAFMSAGDVSIAGTIFVYPDGVSPTDACNGVTTTAAGADNDYPGGGGGGYGTPGAQGGNIFLVANGGAGGPVGGTATLTPLRGGCRGGNSAGFASAPGDGGGAIQITSATRIDVGGKIGTPGLGGQVCAGGGAGGGILLEAPVVTLAGGLYANGGAGGCGDYVTDNPGNNGQLAMTPATQVCASKSGGQGGYGTTAPTQGDVQNNTTGSNYGAGGGAAVGRIRINTLDMTVTGGGEQSPPVSTGPVGSR